MKVQLLDDADGQILMFWCPGCRTHHGPVVKSNGGKRPLWTWNQDLDRPTLTPSVRVQSTRTLTDAEAAQVLAGQPVVPHEILCHLFLTDGRIYFLGDCTHDHAGRVVELTDLED